MSALSHCQPAGGEAKAIALKDVKIGDYVKRAWPSVKTYQRGEYDRSSKKYALIDCDDTNREVWLQGRTVVLIGFTY